MEFTTDKMAQTLFCIEILLKLPFALDPKGTLMDLDHTIDGWFINVLLIPRDALAPSSLICVIQD